MTGRRFFILCVVLLGAVVLFGVHRYSNSRTSQMFGEIVARVETDKPLVALTFDDGPSARFTQDVLTMLKERNVKGTFFLTGKETEKTCPMRGLLWTRDIRSAITPTRIPGCY